MEYYSAIKKNEIMPFAATWMDPEMIILSEVSQKKKDKLPYYITYMWNLKYDRNKLIYKTETDLWEFGVGRIQTIIYRMDKQQGPTV